MTTKLAGHTPLTELISQAIAGARSKIASASSSVKEVKVEETKLASAIDFRNPEEIEKLASALEGAAEKIASGNVIDHGGESAQGGQQLPVGSMDKKKQVYSKPGATKHTPPMNPGVETAKDNGPSKTLLQDNDTQPAGKTPYPSKGVLKTSAFIPFKPKEKEEDGKDKKDPKEEDKEKNKKASALDFLLDKVSATRFSGESAQGGMTLDSAAQEGVSIPKGGTNSARSNIDSASRATNYKKVDAKKIQKPLLAQVLTEPAMSSAKDHVVQDNLHNATKGGVKIAAAKAYLSKIKEAGCTCDGEGSCKYCKLKSAMDKKSSGNV